MFYLQHIHYRHHHHLHHYILYITHITYIFCTIVPASSLSSSSPPPSSSFYLTYNIYITYPLFFHQLIYMTCIIYNAYMPYIIIYIAASLHHLPLQTYLTLHHLQDLQTSSSSSTIYIDNDTYISHRWWTSRELLQNLKNVVYTGVDLQVIHFYLNSYKSPACKVICTEIVAQELLHRSSANFQWSNCMWTPAKSDFSSSSISLWRQRQPGGGLRNVTLCGVSDTQTCGEMRVLFVLGPRSNRLRRQRSRRSDIQTRGKMQIWQGPAQPLRTKWGSTIKNWCILKVQMQAWHES